MDKQFVLEILQYITTAFIAFSVWGVKGILKIVFENRDKIKDNFFKIDVAQEQIKENKSKLDNHETRLDEHDKAINTIIITHNATDCSKHIKIDA